VAEPPSVFLVTLEGVESPAGAVLTVLAFARADDEAAAMAAAAVELAALGWTGVRALRTGELIDWSALPDDFRAPVATALRHGCSLIIYEEP
jgi:hypothetical protein